QPAPARAAATIANNAPAPLAPPAPAPSDERAAQVDDAPSPSEPAPDTDPPTAANDARFTSTPHREEPNEEPVELLAAPHKRPEKSAFRELLANEAESAPDARARAGGPIPA